MRKKGMGFSKGELTRQKMVRVALKLIARKGFSETSFQDIADSCGLSQSAVLHHFQNKGNLLREVISAIVQDNHQLVASNKRLGDNAHESLSKHFSGNMRWALENPDGAKIILLLYSWSCFDSSTASLYEEIVRTGRTRIQELVLAGVREGLFSLSEEPALIAELLHDALVGSFVYAVATPGKGNQLKKMERKWKLLIRRLTGHLNGT